MMKLAPMKPLERSARTIPFTLSVDSSCPAPSPATPPPAPPIPPSWPLLQTPQFRPNSSDWVGWNAPARHRIAASPSILRLLVPR
uniref:Uncharacterized protein n=1 Tax=Arundo donax TaxID=35708 RepID=A0A0A9FHW9_ARUDO